MMVCSLARGALGDQASRLLGAVLIAKFRVLPTAALISHERSGAFSRCLSTNSTSSPRVRLAAASCRILPLAAASLDLVCVSRTKVSTRIRSRPKPPWATATPRWPFRLTPTSWSGSSALWSGKRRTLMPNRRGSKKAPMRCFYAEPVGMLRPSFWRSDSCTMQDASRLSRGVRSGSAGTASRWRGRFAGGSSPWLVRCVCTGMLNTGFCSLSVTPRYGGRYF